MSLATIAASPYAIRIVRIPHGRSVRPCANNRSVVRINLGVVIPLCFNSSIFVYSDTTNNKTTHALCSLQHLAANGCGIQWRTQEFCSGGVQHIRLRTEDRENGDLGAVRVLEASVIWYKKFHFM